MRALRASMVRHVLTKIQPTNVNVLMDILVTDVILEVSFFSGMHFRFKICQNLAVPVQTRTGIWQEFTMHGSFKVAPYSFSHTVRMEIF